MVIKSNKNKNIMKYKELDKDYKHRQRCKKKSNKNKVLRCIEHCSFVIMIEAICLEQNA